MQREREESWAASNTAFSAAAPLLLTTASKGVDAREIRSLNIDSGPSGKCIEWVLVDAMVVVDCPARCPLIIMEKWMHDKSSKGQQ